MVVGDGGDDSGCVSFVLLFVVADGEYVGVRRLGVAPVLLDDEDNDDNVIDS